MRRGEIISNIIASLKDNEYAGSFPFKGQNWHVFHHKPDQVIFPDYEIITVYFCFGGEENFLIYCRAGKHSLEELRDEMLGGKA